MQILAEKMARFVCLSALLVGCAAETGGRSNSSPTANMGPPGVMQGTGASPGVNPGTNPGAGGSGPGVVVPGSGGMVSIATGGGMNATPPGVVPGLRRLSHVEYNHTVLDVLKTSSVVQTGDAITSGIADGFALDNLVGGYDNARAVLVVTPSLAGQYREAAKKLASEALAGVGLSTLAPCAQGVPESTCATDFVKNLGTALFRRPPDATELAQFAALFDTERARSDYAASIQQVLEVMLQSPSFLYRSEYGVPAPGGGRTLTSYEVASLLSYTFWNAPPDAELMGLAAQDQLTTAAAREAQARRLLASPRARNPLERFITLWTQTSGVATVVKVESVYPLFDGAMRRATVTAQADFIRKTTWDGDGSLGALLSGDMGMLTQPWLLAVHSHADESFPIARGKFVRTRLLCQDLPAPPQNLNVMPVPKEPNATTRERFMAHSTNPACSGCHQLIDPIGFGFERYDGIGQYRTTENGKPVDDAGEVTSSEDANGPFHGPGELGTRLATSAEVQRCAVSQAFRFTFGYNERPPEMPALAAVSADLKLANNNLRELFVLLAKSDQFVTRIANP